MPSLPIFTLIILLSILHPTFSTNITNVFEAFIRTYGQNKTISASGLSGFVSRLRSNDSSFIHRARIRVEAMNGSCPSCSFTCESVSSIFESNGFTPDAKLSAEDLKKILPSVFARIQNPYCYQAKVKEKQRKKDLVNGTVWGYGFLMVTIINGCALLGFAFTPFIGRHYYKLIMTFMVALAVGSLCGSAILFLFPDALKLSEMEALLPEHTTYVWKSTVVMGGIFLFFWLERALKFMIEWKEGQRGHTNLKGQSAPQDASSCSMNIRRVPDIDPALKEYPRHHEEAAAEEDFEDGGVTAGGDRRRRTSSRNSTNSRPQLRSVKDSTSEKDVAIVVPDAASTTLVNGSAGNKTSISLTKIAPVAWMIIVGDGVHNFIDGLSIGAAFSQNVVTGFSLSMAVLCEELPHELGDFAILLNSGMSVKHAMIANFGSACFCYLGLVIGIVVGELTEAAVWIFSLAAGMFLYISLVDMLPEVNHMMESDDARRLGRLKVFLLQNLGMLTGYAMLLALALYGEQIQF